jgi:hypothetical protein
MAGAAKRTIGTIVPHETSQELNQPLIEKSPTASLELVFV